MMNGYTGFDIDGDGRAEINSLKALFPNPEPYYATPNGVVIVLVDPHLVTDDPNIRMSRFGWSFLTEAGRHLAVEDQDGVVPDVGLKERGYLYLAAAGREAALREVHATQRAEGADVVLESPTDLTTRFPWLALDGVGLGSLGLHGEGWFDGYGLVQAFRSKA